VKVNLKMPFLEKLDDIANNLKILRTSIYLQPIVCSIHPDKVPDITRFANISLQQSILKQAGLSSTVGLRSNISQTARIIT
jgi:hypothetical protein